MVLALAANQASAADTAVSPVVPADVAVIPIWPEWYTHGDVEFGGQGFIHKPDNSRSDNLAKFEEYGNRTSPAFLEYLNLEAGTKDGLYYGEFLALHAGQNNQFYGLDLEKSGEQYLTLTWDQVPHLFSTTAQTPFVGIGSPFLFVNPALITALNAATNTAGTNTTIPVQQQVFNGANVLPNGCFLPGNNGGNPAGCKGLTPALTAITSNLNTTNLGIERDKALVEYRYTPTQEWDVKVSYSHERRRGTQEAGFLFGSAGTSAPMAQVPKPISDSTQDATVSAEYAGYSFWGQKWNAMLSYNASIYKDDLLAFDVVNPFGAPPIPGMQCAIAATAGTPNDCFAFGQMSTPPSNWSGRILATTGIDLPLNSRYMGTFAYTAMKQNDQFIPMTVNPGPIPFTSTTATPASTIMPFAPVPIVPRPSLDGSIDTLLSNNVLTTQFSPDWRNKASYRYYSQDNNTPPLTLASWVVNDSRLTGVNGVGSSTTAGVLGSGYSPHTTMFSSYIKQDFTDDVTWRPAKWLNTGVGYAWERYDRSLSQVNTTNENAIRAFADVTLAQWMLLRASYSYSARRYDNYDWNQYVGSIILSGSANINGFYTGGMAENPLMRTFDMANRDRKLSKISIDITPVEGLTITPFGGLRFDDYPVDSNIARLGQVQLGITRDHNWNSGVEATYILNHFVTVMASYTWERYDRNLVSSASSGSCLFTPDPVTAMGQTCSYNLYGSSMFESVNTFVAGTNITIIPERLSLKLLYTYVYGKDSWTTGPFDLACTGTNCFNGVNAVNGINIVGLPSPGSPAFPDYNNIANRFDGSVKYVIDPTITALCGWLGETFIRVRYLYESNKITNWQNDIVQAYLYAATNSSTTGLKQQIFMAGDNPNYTAQAVVATFGAKW